MEDFKMDDIGVFKKDGRIKAFFATDKYTLPGCLWLNVREGAVTAVTEEVIAGEIGDMLGMRFERLAFLNLTDMEKVELTAKHQKKV